ncbi:glycosyltransferase family 2 protein [Alienimonas sp. DA493]|uniref:glycosyltransferase family 2 protein n=1 Tax=Alienimonas sp. DA493 TaxID=3373605 RepID=UPI0037547D8C
MTAPFSADARSIAAELSVVTVTRNNAEGLAKTLQSLRDQSARPAETVVIDGDSTDATPATLERFADVVDVIERDRGTGIYAAMNQGTAAAAGRWVCMLNAGDRLADPGVLRAVRPEPGAELIFGEAVTTAGEPHLRRRDLARPWAGMPFSHQALFCRRELLLARPFDERLRIAADFDFVLWAVRTGRSVQDVPRVICEVELGGVSSTQPVRRILESYRVASRHYPLRAAMHQHYWGKLRWALRERLPPVRTRLRGLRASTDVETARSRAER